MTDGFFSEGKSRPKCICGADWRLHCSHRCGWYRCSKDSCSGRYNYRAKRFFIFRKDIP